MSRYRSIDTWDILGFDTYKSMFQCRCGCRESHIDLFLFRGISELFENVNRRDYKFMVISSFHCSSDIKEQRLGKAVYLKVVNGKEEHIKAAELVRHKPSFLKIAEKNNILKLSV